MKTLNYQEFFNSGKMFLMAGPCVIESEQSALYHAEKLKEITSKLNVPFVYKSSYRKANRSAFDAFTGVGIEKGLAILAKVKEQFDVPILTDVHETAEVSMVAQVADVLQVPAFLMRQSDLITAIGLSGRVANIKKAQFASPYDMKYVVEKLHVTGNRKILLTERGTSFGYGSLVVDMKSFAIMKELDYPTIIDCTHSTQTRVGNGAVTGGERQFAAILAKASIAAGADGVFAEVHQDPANAKSDAATQLFLSEFPDFLRRLLDLHAACRMA